MLEISDEQFSAMIAGVMDELPKDAGIGTTTVITNICDGVSGQVAVEAAMAEREWTAALGAVTEEVADCFERREPCAVVREMTEAMLVELDTRKC